MLVIALIKSVIRSRERYIFLLCDMTEVLKVEERKRRPRAWKIIQNREPRLKT